MMVLRGPLRCRGLKPGLATCKADIPPLYYCSDPPLTLACTAEGWEQVHRAEHWLLSGLPTCTKGAPPRPSTSRCAMKAKARVDWVWLSTLRSLPGGF